MLVQARGSLGAVAILLAFLPTAASAGVKSPTVPLPALTAGPDHSAGRCAVVDQDRQAKKRPRRGVLGWLYRYTRNIDVERGSTPLPLFLRSPLLTAVPTPSDCETESEPIHGQECAAIVVSVEKDASLTTAVPLPQLGASTPARLADAVRTRLADGEAVELKTSRGGLIDLIPDHVRGIEAKNCVVDA
jgi:hypothetical protein